MELTKRQIKILDWIVKDYIELASPISSELIERRHKTDISSPMIRIEMQRLTERGYIEKPHTSAGRVPTDKGYRFFVDRSMKKLKEREIKIEEWLEEMFQDAIKLTQILTKFLARETETFVFGYLKEKEILFKEGWQVLKEPEFKNKDLISKFLKFVIECEDRIRNFKDECEIKIFIGKENPIKTGKDFSLLISECFLPKKKGEGLFALLGPKRMNYPKNLSLLNSLKKILETMKK
jgi:heat-inducible transcriptional repressor